MISRLFSKSILIKLLGFARLILGFVKVVGVVHDVTKPQFQYHFLFVAFIISLVGFASFVAASSVHQTSFRHPVLCYSKIKIKNCRLETKLISSKKRKKRMKFEQRPSQFLVTWVKNRHHLPPTDRHGIPKGSTNSHHHIGIHQTSRHYSQMVKRRLDTGMRLTITNKVMILVLS